MTEPMNHDDMLTLLGEALNEDQPPVEALELAYASFGWRTLEADLAQLIEDSQVEVVGFHQKAYSRLLTYDSALGTIEVGVDDDSFEVAANPAPHRVVAHHAGQVALGLGIQLDDQMKYIDTNKKQETNISGVFAAGDICGPPWQMAKAVGEGCVAGIGAANYAKKLATSP